MRTFVEIALKAVGYFILIVLGGMVAIFTPFYQLARGLIVCGIVLVCGGGFLAGQVSFGYVIIGGMIMVILYLPEILYEWLNDLSEKG